MSDLLEVVPLLSIAFAAVGGLVGVIQSVFSLRAKRRMRDLLIKKALKDPKVQQVLAAAAADGKLTSLDMEEAILAINRALSDLPPGDRERVKEGLLQSRASEERYVTNLLKAA